MEDTFDKTLTEINFEYELYGPNDWYEYSLWLNQEELQQVFTLLDSNPNALFNEIPKELYDAFQEAAEHQVLEEGRAPGLGKEYETRVDLQKEMPQDLLDLYNEYKLSNQEDAPEGEISRLNLKVSRAEMLAISKGSKSYRLEICPENEEILLELEAEENEDGSIDYYKLEDEDGNTIAHKFDVICFYSGKDPEGAHVIVSVNDVSVEAAADNHGYPISYKVDGENYLVEEVVYELGEIIEQNVNPGKKTAADRKEGDEGIAMKCLAVRQPWAQLIVTGIKDIELREAMPAPKKPKVFIAASGTKLKWDELDEYVQGVYKKYEQKGILPPYNDLPTKCIVGYVDIVKASFDPVESIWGRDWDGMKYTLRNAMELDKPITGKNKATPYFYNVEGYDENNLPPAHKVELDDAEDEDDEMLSPEEEEIQSNIKTKEELFQYIDSKLTDEEKQEVMKSESCDLHFGFGTWLRNLIIYPGIIDVLSLLNGKEDKSDIWLVRFGHPDTQSSELIDAYQTYLLEKNRK